MNFDQFPYARPNVEAFQKDFNILLEAFDSAKSAEAQNQLIDQINELRIDFMTAYNIAHVRHTIDTKDAFYEEENNFFDEQMPFFEAINNQFYIKVLHSPFRSDLEKHWGKQFFTLAELSLRTFDPIVLEDLQEENRLSSEYTKLKAAARVQFRGEEYNLSSIYPHEIAADRQTRKEASQAKWSFFVENASVIDELFDQLVKVRHRIAQKLGYANFIELGYARMQRSDYDAGMVANFRSQIRDFIVPITTELYERQRKRLGIENIQYYDEEIRLLGGNPQPKGSPEWIVEQAAKMYADLSSETDTFFTLMRERGLMDLLTRPNKAPGGYCTYIARHQAPYIFSNFNGTSADIDVLTHEAGHAFQVYSSRHWAISEYTWPTTESCEIHSMSMEFFTWPWMPLFFGEEADKHCFVHLNNALCFLPYGVAVDEFQHFVYENPEATPAERNQAWRALERSYLPHRQYEGNDFLEGGGFWQKQSHIFNVPFYYIDYCLAQICAFQFWKRDKADHVSAWADYVQLCQAGGSRSFVELVKLAGLHSPFEEGCVASVIEPIREWLDSVDDQTFV